MGTTPWIPRARPAASQTQLPVGRRARHGPLELRLAFLSSSGRLARRRSMDEKAKEGRRNLWREGPGRRGHGVACFASMHCTGRRGLCRLAQPPAPALLPPAPLKPLRVAQTEIEFILLQVRSRSQNQSLQIFNVVVLSFFLSFFCMSFFILLFPQTKYYFCFILFVNIPKLKRSKESKKRRRRVFSQWQERTQCMYVYMYVCMYDLSIYYALFSLFSYPKESAL